MTVNKGALAILVHGGTDNWSPERWNDHSLAVTISSTISRGLRADLVSRWAKAVIRRLVLLAAAAGWRAAALLRFVVAAAPAEMLWPRATVTPPVDHVAKSGVAPQ